MHKQMTHGWSMTVSPVRLYPFYFLDTIQLSREQMTWPLLCFGAVCLRLLWLNVIRFKGKALSPTLPWAMGIICTWNTGCYSALNPGIVSAPWCLIGSVQVHVNANLPDISSFRGGNGKQWLHSDKTACMDFTPVFPLRAAFADV